MGDVREAPGTEWDGHVLLLHRTEGERLAGLTAWVRRGLELGEKIIYTELPLMPEDALVPVLEAWGVDVAAAVRDGQLVLLPPEEFYPPEGQRVVVECALAEGFPSVRISAEVRAALSVLSPSAVQGVEQRLDALVGELPMSAMCQYSEAATTGTWLDDAVATHLSGVHQSTLSTSRDLDGLALHGEVDATNTGVFTAVLSAASRHGSRVLWVDLGEVSYIDAGSCWRLDDATRRYRSSGGHVMLVAPQPPVELTMRMLEVDELPGMHLVGGDR